MPSSSFLRAGAVPGGDGEPLAAADARLDLGHAVLRHRELDVDRVELGDDRDAGGVAGADVVADVDRAQADPSRHRRDDPGVAEIEARGVLVGAVDDERRLELLDRGRLGVDVLAGDRVLAEQGLVALQLHPAVLELGLVAHARADRLLQGDLERPRIDGREQLALLHHLPFGEGDRGQHARDLGPHRHRDRGDDGAERVEHHRQVGAGRGGDADGARRRPDRRGRRRDRPGRRIGRAAPDAPEPAATAANGPPGRRGRPVRQVPGERGQADQADDGDDGAEPATARRRARSAAAGRIARADRIACGSGRGKPGRLTRRGRTRRVERIAGQLAIGMRSTAPPPRETGVGARGKTDVDGGFWRKLFFTRPVEAFTPH